MADNLPVDDALIGKYLSGEATPAETERVRQWLADADEPARQSFAQTEAVWNLSGQAKPGGPVDTDAAWTKVQTQMHRSDAVADNDTTPTATPIRRPLPIAPERPFRRQYGRIAAVAAVLFLALFTGITVWQLRISGDSAAVMSIVIATTTARRTLTLPDGSRVTLNRNSRLTYPATFADSSRAVSLAGEAFFDVKPDPTHPFRIGAGPTTVRVLGTSFAVRAVGDSVRVTVKTGRVRFSTPHQAVVLRPNQEATYLAPADTIRRALQITPNALAFQTGRITFTNESLADVIRTLREVYSAEIELAPAVRTCRYTGTFTNEPLDAVLGVIGETLSLTIRREGSRIVVNGTACE